MRRGRERHVGGAVQRFVERIAPRDPLTDAIRAWPEAVGEALAAHSAPSSLRDRTLTVECSGSVYAQELELMSRKVLASLSELLGEDSVKRLRFTVAPKRRGG